jgi:iron complex outermembrane recepter protein
MKAILLSPLSRTCARSLAISAVLLSQSILHAQTAAVTSPRAEGEEETVTLNPFEVNTAKDDGYQAASTVSATALATPLRESSSIVSVLTKEFLDDIAATTIDEAASWAPNTYFISTAERNDEALTSFNSNAVMRGINAQANFARNYFITNAPLDPATIERIEQPRGPNAALFGAAPQVGMINVNPKRALFQRRSNTVGFRADSEGSVRATLDANLGRDHLAIRLNGMKEVVRGWRDGDVSRNELMLLSGAWRLTRKTTLRTEILLDYRESTFPPPTLYENVSRWDGITMFTGPRTVNPAVTTGTTRISGNNNYILFDSTNDYANPLDWRGFGRTTGANLAAYPEADLAAEYRPGLLNVPVLPSRAYNFNPTNPPMGDKKTTSFGGSLEHVFFDKLAAQLAYNYTSTEVNKWQFSFSTFYQDINTVRPDGSPNPRFGEWYSDNAYRRDVSAQFSRDVRLLLSYPIRWRFMEQSFVLMGGRRHQDTDLDRFQLVQTNHPTIRDVNNLNIRVYYRRYASDASTEFPSVREGTFGSYTFGLYPWNLVYSRSEYNYWQAAMAGRYWDGRVTTTFGWRHDDVETTNLVRLTPTLLDTPLWSHFQWAEPQKSKPDSMTGGVVVFPVSWVGVFANYAEGFNIQGVRPDLFGNLWGTPKYEGTDVGLKIEFLGGRVSGTVSRYTSKRTGVDPQTFSPQNNFGQLWIDTVNGYTALAASATSAGDLAAAAQNTARAAAAQTEKDRIVGTAYDSRDVEANGYEVDITANLTRNWRAILNFGVPETRQSDSSPISRAYYEEHRAEWESNLKDSTNFNTASISNQLKAIDDGFRNQADGASLTGTPDYSANLFTNYRFASGALKGLRVGGGVQFQGPRIIGVPVTFTPTSGTAGTFAAPDLLATIKSESTQIYTAMASYDFKVGSRRVRLQLNVSNLFDDDRLIPTTLATYLVTGTPLAAGYQVPDRFRIANPRTFSLTCTFDL